MEELENGIAKAIEEFVPLFDELTTSDLQGCAMARAMRLLQEQGNSRPALMDVMMVQDTILEGIYSRM